MLNKEQWTALQDVAWVAFIAEKCCTRDSSLDWYF